jgi:hypothetical protein
MPPECTMHCSMHEMILNIFVEFFKKWWILGSCRSRSIMVVHGR